MGDKEYYDYRLFDEECERKLLANDCRVDAVANHHNSNNGGFGGRRLGVSLQHNTQVEALYLHPYAFQGAGTQEEDLSPLLDYIATSTKLKLVWLDNGTRIHEMNGHAEALIGAIARNPSNPVVVLGNGSVSTTAFARIMALNFARFELFHVEFVAAQNDNDLVAELTVAFAANKELRTLLLRGSTTSYFATVLQSLSRQMTLRYIYVDGGPFYENPAFLVPGSFIGGGCSSSLKHVHFSRIDTAEWGVDWFALAAQSLIQNSNVTRLTFEACTFEEWELKQLVSVLDHGSNTSRNVTFIECSRNGTAVNTSTFKDLFMSRGLAKLDLSMDTGVVMLDNDIVTFQLLVNLLADKNGSQIKSLFLPHLALDRLNDLVQYLPYFTKLRHLKLKSFVESTTLVEGLMGAVGRNCSLWSIQITASSFLTKDHYTKIGWFGQRNRFLPALLQSTPETIGHGLTLSIWPRLIHAALVTAMTSGPTETFPTLCCLGERVCGSSNANNSNVATDDDDMVLHKRQKTGF